jgi:hypothetical protein
LRPARKCLLHCAVCSTTRALADPYCIHIYVCCPATSFGPVFWRGLLLAIEQYSYNNDADDVTSLMCTAPTCSVCATCALYSSATPIRHDVCPLFTKNSKKVDNNNNDAY